MSSDLIYCIMKDVHGIADVTHQLLDGRLVFHHLNALGVGIVADTEGTWHSLGKFPAKMISEEGR